MKKLQVVINFKLNFTRQILIGLVSSCLRYIMKQLPLVHWGSDINRDVIKLLSKEDTSQLRNWKPITLLDMFDKIYAKILTRRVEKVLPKITSPTQIGFLEGKHILDNLLTSWEGMNWAKMSKQNVSMALNIFEKAF